MKNRPYHTNSALQTWEEKNYMKLMSRKIQAAKSTLPKLPSNSKSPHTAESARHASNKQVPGPEPRHPGCANRVDGGTEALPAFLQPSEADAPLTAFVSPAKHVSSRKSRYGAAWSGEHPGQPITAPPPAVPRPQPASALLQLQTAIIQHATAVAPLPGVVPQPAAAVPLQPGTVSPDSSLVQSGTPGGLHAGTHRAPGIGLPPIPGQSAKPSRSPKQGQKATQTKAASPGRRGAGLVKGKQKGSVQMTGRRPPYVKANKPLPGWNSDFSIQYQEAPSIKDQERALRRTALGGTKQPLVSVASKDGRSGTAKDTHPAEAAQGSWPVLNNSSHNPAAVSNSKWLLPQTVCQDNEAAACVKQNGDAGTGVAIVQPGQRQQLKGRVQGNKQRRDSTAYSRNLDSAQSPLRPAKGHMAADETALCKLNKFCFLPIQDTATGKNRAIVASTSIPPLLDALVHSQGYPQDQPCDTPLASFFMHSSSKTPLTSSELEPCSPSHPLFSHTSQQHSPCSSKQSPTCLQHRRISAQQSTVRSWKALRPENRATLDGSSDLLAGIQGTTEVGPALQAYDSFLRPCNAASIDTALPQATAAHVQHAEILGQGRAENAETPVHMPFSVIQFPVEPSGMQESCPASTEGKASHTAPCSDSSMQAAHVADAVAGTYCSTAGLGSSATAGCAECSNHASQSSLPMFVSYNRVGASPTGGCQSSAGELSALNSADLAYLGGETSATLSAGFSAPLCGSSSSSRASSNASSGQQAASRSPDAWPCVQDSFTLESCGNGPVSSRISSGTARNIRGVHCHGSSGNHVELLHNCGSDDVVLSGSDSELRDQSSSCAPMAACRVSGTNAQNQCHSIVLAETAETANNGRLQSMGSAVEHGHIAELPCSASPAASCDSLYEDDWEA